MDSAREVALPGLRLTPVDENLAAYFGEGSARGLLVVQADRIRAAFEPQRRATVELVRRRRVLTVALRGRAGA